MNTTLTRSTLVAVIILITALYAKAINLYTYTNGGTTGAWNNAGTWTTDPTGTTLTGSAVPGNNDVVTILNGFAVTLSANVTSTNLVIIINNGGTLDLSTFQFTQPINTLSGGGTLKINAGYFPSITNYAGFLNSYATGATVEYYNFSGTLPVSINYPNLTFSNSTTSNHVISFGNTSAYSATINGNFVTRTTGSGNLTVTIGTQITNAIGLTINGNCTIGNSTTWNVGSFNIAHSIIVNGNFSNNGTVDFTNAASQYATNNNGLANLIFTGASDNTLSCNGVTELNSLTVNKGLGSTNILSVTSTNTNNLKFFGTGQLITVTQGTLRLGENIVMDRVCGGSSCPSTGNYDIGTTTTSPMLWIDGANVNTNSIALVVYGKFRITSGSFTTMGGEGSVIRIEGQYIIEGGTFTTEKFRPSTETGTHRGSFTMTGGIFNTSGTTGSNGSYARFSLPFPEQVFIMSGGTINVSNPQSGNNGGIHIGVKASNYNVTGGTFNAILSGSAATYSIASTAPLYNLTISRTGGTPTIVRLSGISNVANTDGESGDPKPLVILNDLIIDGTNLPTFDASGLNVTVGRNFIINSGATYMPGANTTIFDGSSDQGFSNSGTITGGLHNLTVNKSTGTLTLAGAASSFTVQQTLTLTRGILNDGGKTLLAFGPIHNEAVHTGTGNITLNGSATQIISGNGEGIFGNLVLSNTNTPGAKLTSDISISGTLTLAGATSLFDIDSYQLSITSPSATALQTDNITNPFGSTKMIRTLGLQSDRGVRKTFGNLSAFTYHVGSASDYAPVTIQLTSAPTVYGAISVKPVNTRHPFVKAGNTNNLQFYWKVVSTGFIGLAASSVNHQYQYPASKISPPGDDVNYIPAHYNNTAWTKINNVTQVNEGARTIFFTGVNVDGDYTAGVPDAFDIVKIFYSIRNGNWNDVNAGTTPWSNDSHTGDPASTFPGASDHVIIGDGVLHNHTITLTNNNQQAGGLEINSGSILDIGTTTGHDFGRLENIQVSGSGLMRISSATALAQFPAGDFGIFIRETGGTVEYYTTGSQSFTIPLNSLAPTNLPLITYRNLILTPNNSLAITLPNQNLLIYDNLTIQGASSTSKVQFNSLAQRTLAVEDNLILSGGNLQFLNGSAQTISVDGDVTIGSPAIFDVSGAGTAVANELTIGGNLINNGTFDMANTTRIANVTFTGPTNTSITGTGSTTDFNTLTLSKGSNQTPILNVNATAFSLSGSGVSLILNNGTFRLTSSQIVTISNGVIFNIPATTRLSANGGTLQIVGGNGIDMRLAGTLEVNTGAVNVGTASNDNSIEYAATGSPTINVSGGSLNVKSQIRRSTASVQGGLIYHQSGGVVTVGEGNLAASTRGTFEILNPGSSFTFSNGSLRIVKPNPGTAISDVYLHPASSNVTGGTLEIGTGGSGETININTGIPLYNLTVAGTTNIARLEFNPLTLRGSMNITGSDNIFNANTLNVSLAGNFTNANTSVSTNFNNGGYQPGSATQTTTINSSTANQTLAGVSGNRTTFSNLVINNTFTGGTLMLQANTTIRVGGTLTLSNGTLNDGGNTIIALGNINNSAVHASSATGKILVDGSSGAQLIGGNGSGKFGNLTISNTSGATFASNQEVTGVLDFEQGSLFINQYELYISNTSLTAITNASASNFIITSGQLSNGGLRKAFASSITNGNFTYPVGVSGKYTPAAYTLTTGVIGGTITVKPVNSKHPGATGSGTAFIDYYWAVSNSVIILTSLTHQYTYAAEDEQGDINAYRDARFKAGAWTIGVTAGNPNIGTRIITFTNTDVAGDYTAGEPTAFVNPTTYTSIASGDWEANDLVWTPNPPGINLGPPAGSFVIISEGHTITITNNTKRPATLDVRGRLHIGTTNGHDFGTVSATGTGERTIQLQSSTFPSGDFTNFMAADGGTVDYNGTVILPTQSIYNNLVFTGPGTKTMPNADLTLNGNLTISQGTVNNSVNNRSIVLFSTTGDFTNNSVFNAGSGPVIVGRNLINSGSGVTFTSPGGGSFGLSVGGNITNSSGATFTAGSDPIAVTGNISNSATFSSSSGTLTVTGNMNNTSGTFTTGPGTVTITGSLTNNAAFTAGGGAIAVTSSFTNTGASAVYAANTNALSVTGSFSNTAGATFNGNTGLTLVRGDWNNSATFNAGTGLVNFAGAGPQALTGSTTFHNVTRSNGGTVTLNNNIQIGGLLTLASGYITTGSHFVSLTNTSTQPVTGQSASSFIDGKLSISYPNAAGTSRIFPVGKGSIYRPVTIQQTSTSTSPVVNVEMINTPPTGTYPTSIQGLSEARYYAINLSSGTMNNPTVELSFNTNAPSDESITVPGNVRIVRATAASGPWTDEGGSGVFSPAAPAGYATSAATSIANPTFFALAYQSTATPITLIAFNASFKDYAVHLHWATAMEINNAFFTIERSKTGRDFDSLFSIDGAGFSHEVLNYYSIDENPFSGTSYYRLKQTDYDGKFSYSEIVRVVNTGYTKAFSSVYPNPAPENYPVFLKMVNENDTKANIFISSVTGLIYYNELVDLKTPLNLSTLKLRYNLSKGVYIIKINSTGYQDTKRLIIH